MSQEAHDVCRQFDQDQANAAKTSLPDLSNPRPSTLVRPEYRTAKRYLGDSVYADFDGYHVVLTTENGRPDDPSNTIALEPAVLEALNLYVEYLKGKTE